MFKMTGTSVMGIWATLVAAVPATGVAGQDQGAAPRAELSRQEAAADGQGTAGEEASSRLRTKALGVIRKAQGDADVAVRLRAIEVLLRLDYSQGIAQVLEEELAGAGPPPGPRVKSWYGLALASHHATKRNAWVKTIHDVARDPAAADRLDALAALVDLGYQAVATAADDAWLVELAESGSDSSAVYAAWILDQSAADDKRTPMFVRFLVSPDAAARRTAAVVMLGQAAAPPQTAQRVVKAAEDEPRDSPVRVPLVAAAFVHAADAAVAERYHGELIGALATSDGDAQAVVCRALAARGRDEDLGSLERLFDAPQPLVRVAAAEAALRIGRRRTHRLTTFDWTVIALYAAGMVAVGWYYARRTATTEDYLLGGRTMSPTAVGLSLFATLLSTITYLAWPGWMIAQGPMILGQVVAYPFIILIVGWLLIPRLMELRVTSAYELLELRLGLSIRILGSLFFLALRLLWMAVIVYATTSKVLVPMMGLTPAATPYVCAVLGLITIIYTSMGGLRAVVATDVVQTLILFGGAVLTLLIINQQMGGFAGWWPERWPVHWEEPVFWYDETLKVTFVGAVLSAFFWHTCTASSDQVAIQRYLATRDVKAARRTFVTSMAASALVLLFLGALGLALLAYYRANPHMIPDGQQLVSGADKLFPQFIVFGLPVGISGLVIAGLLAAAMSSLSSGVNSSCSVITVDFIDRFRGPDRAQADPIRTAKYVSVAVGLVVVLLSSVVGEVKGDLLEVTFKVVNLLVTPLACLFFMALFVPWATSFGALVGAAFGLATAVAVNYWEEMTGRPGISFIWAMPVSFLIQMAVGMAASWAPVGRRPVGVPTGE